MVIMLTHQQSIIAWQDAYTYYYRSALTPSPKSTNISIEPLAPETITYVRKFISPLSPYISSSLLNINDLLNRCYPCRSRYYNQSFGCGTFKIWCNASISSTSIVSYTINWWRKSSCSAYSTTLPPIEQPIIIMIFTSLFGYNGLHANSSTFHNYLTKYLY